MADLLPGVSLEEIEKAIRESAEVKAEQMRVAKAMVDHAKSISPHDEGYYKAAWKVSKGRGPNGLVWVVNPNFKAHWVEDGRAASKGHPAMEAHNVAAHTAMAFGGTAGDVVRTAKK